MALKLNWYWQIVDMVKVANLLENWVNITGAYVVAIRSNHGVWLPSGQSVRANK